MVIAFKIDSVWLMALFRWPHIWKTWNTWYLGNFLNLENSGNCLGKIVTYKISAVSGVQKCSKILFTMDPTGSVVLFQFAIIAFTFCCGNT